MICCGYVSFYWISPDKQLSLISVFVFQNNNFCASVLLLCHSWGEIHVSLCDTDTG